MLDTRAANRITVGFNLPSKALGAKDLIKIENKQLTQKQVNQLALLAPTATVNIIENFEVVQKYHPELPEKIEGNSNVNTVKKHLKKRSSVQHWKMPEDSKLHGI